MNKNNFFNFKQKNIWDLGWPMSPRKFFIFIVLPAILILFSTFLFACTPKIEKVDKVTYHFELTLIDGSIRKESHVLYEDMDFVISASKNGAYGLKISKKDLMDKTKYGLNWTLPDDGFVAWGVINFKIDSISK